MKQTIKKVFVLLFVLAVTLNICGCSILPDPQKPKAKHGEFPFELVCEIDGEEVTFKDTLVIEYKGTMMDAGSGKYNVWNKSLLNSTVDFYCDYNEIFLKKGTTEDGGSYRICLYLGSFPYYMGLEETETSKRDGIYPGDFVLHYIDKDLGDRPIEKDNFLNFSEQSIDEQTLYEKYNIKILKKSISDPL